MTESDVLIAKIRASEQREREQHDAAFDQSLRDLDASVCAGCGRRWVWGQAVMNRAKPPVYIPEVDRHFHLVCYEKWKEGR